MLSKLIILIILLSLIGCETTPFDEARTGNGSSRFIRTRESFEDSQFFKDNELFIQSASDIGGINHVFYSSPNYSVQYFLMKENPNRSFFLDFIVGFEAFGVTYRDTTLVQGDIDFAKNSFKELFEITDLDFDLAFQDINILRENREPTYKTENSIYLIYSGTFIIKAKDKIFGIRPL